MSWGNPPSETGRRIATFARTGPQGERLELRVHVDEYEGRPYVGVRMWKQDPRGGWWPTPKGTTIRRSELAGFIECLQEAYAELGEPDPPPTNPKAERQQRFLSDARNGSLASSQGFSEFDE
jgi:hypothetical protein